MNSREEEEEKEQKNCSEKRHEPYKNIEYVINGMNCADASLLCF